MTRKSFIQILEDKYDINREFERITTLFDSDLITHKILLLTRLQKEYYTIEKMVAKVFYQWKGRGTCISCQDLRIELGVNEIVNKKSRSADEILLCLEYYLNIDKLFMKKIAPTMNNNNYYLNLDNYTMMQTNFNKLLDHLHQQIISEDNDIFLIIPKDPAATAVAEISSKDIAFAILKYHHASLKGQVEEKRKLLLSIANEYEPLLKKPIDGFTEYFDKATNMLNNMNIRHNNKSGKNKKELVAQISDEELESWYDELYQLLLFCVLIKDNKERKDKVDDLLKRINTQPKKQ